MYLSCHHFDNTRVAQPSSAVRNNQGHSEWIANWQDYSRSG